MLEVRVLVKQVAGEELYIFWRRCLGRKRSRCREEEKQLCAT
jgi:hypothetical protein